MISVMQRIFHFPPFQYWFNSLGTNKRLQTLRLSAYARGLL